MSVSVQDVSLIAGSAAGLLASVGWFLRRLRKAFRTLDAIEHLVQRELAAPEDGDGSMKADVHGMALAIGKLQRDRDRDSWRLTRALRLAARHHPEDAQIYLRLAAEERNER